MPQHHRALRAARIILAGPVVASGKGGAVGLRTREDVVAIRRVAAPVSHVTFFAKRRLLGQIIGSVQVGNVFCDGHSFGIDPRSLADAVARIDGPRTLRRQISMPGLATGADDTRKLLAMTIGAS